jgi:PAS domain S-box-containing protein
MGERSRNLTESDLAKISDALFVEAVTCLALLDRSRRFLRVNASMARRMAKKPEEIQGKECSEIFSIYGIESSNTKTSLDRAVETKRPVQVPAMPFKFMDRPGLQTTYCDLTIQPILDAQGEVEFLFLSMNEVTERQQMEDDLRYERKLLRLLIDNVPDLMYTKDTACRKTLANMAEVRRLGAKCESDLLGKDDFALHPRELAEGFFADDQFVIQTGQPLLNKEEYMLNQDGKKGWLLTSKLPLRDEKGQIIGLVGIGRDITERKEAEERVKRLNEELEDRVTKRTAELEVAYEELEAFSYSVSHDLRAPLRHASGYIDLLLKRCKSELSEKAQHYLDSIADSVHHMGILIDDLLQFSRTGRVEMRQSVSDMKAIVDDVVRLLNHENPHRSIEWVIGELPAILCDPALLKLVWVNLLNNAVKFTRKKEKAIIEIGARESDKEIVFSVHDNGVGFDMRYAQKLFGVFQRLHSLEEFEGTGIGLANVRNIISRHGGRTWGEAKLSEGATFYFTLPKNEGKNHHRSQDNPAGRR